jgi:multiple sugar transport system substrate-binding protein
MFNADKTEVTLDSPANVEALQWMVDKVNKYHVSPTDIELAGQSDTDAFKAGKIAMLRTGIWMFADFTANAKFNWDIALEPGNTAKAHHFFANGVAVSSTSQNQAAAYEWLKFLTSSKEAVEIRIKAGWELPAVSDPAYLQGYLDQPVPASREVVFQALDTAVTPPVINNWSQLTDIVGKELEAAKLGQKTPQQALTDAAAAVKGFL